MDRVTVDGIEVEFKHEGAASVAIWRSPAGVMLRKSVSDGDDPQVRGKAFRREKLIAYVRSYAAGDLNDQLAPEARSGKGGA